MTTNIVSKMLDQRDRRTARAALEKAAQDLTQFYIRPEKVDMNNAAQVRAYHIYQFADDLMEIASEYDD